MKTPLLWVLVAIAVIGVGGYFLTQNTPSPGEETETPTNATTVEEGTYEVVAEESGVGWAGKRPLIEGYINTGSIAVSSGTIVVVGETASGEFTIDMDTLSVSATPTKPGRENALEERLKGDRWFNVAVYPTATFVITSVAKRAESDTTHEYDVEGNLTMKGNTNTIAFPALIYEDAEGLLHANAAFEVDRTKWGLTSGSASFFDDLADEVIDDMVGLSIDIVARPI